MAFEWSSSPPCKGQGVGVEGMRLSAFNKETSDAITNEAMPLFHIENSYWCHQPILADWRMPWVARRFPSPRQRLGKPQTRLKAPGTLSGARQTPPSLANESDTCSHMC